MRYSDNTVFQKFVGDLVEALKYENKCRKPNGKQLDIPFLISGLWQDLKDHHERYDKFYSDLQDCDNYNITVEDSD